jgi:hypothetical protein
MSCRPANGSRRKVLSCLLPFVRVAQRCCAIDRDRAAVVTTAVLSIVATAAPTQIRQAVECYLRGEFDALSAQIAGDRELTDV